MSEISIARLYCPKCGTQNVVESPSSNCGELYVAEEFDNNTEFFDDAIPYQCDNCQQHFYLGR